MRLRAGSATPRPFRLATEANADYVEQSFMTATQYGGIGPVARAVERFGTASLALRRRTAAEALAGMLDLQGSVQLAHCLGASKGDADGGNSAPTVLPDYVRKRLAAIEDGAVRRLARPFDGARVRVADPPRLFSELTSSGALASRKGARAFAEDTWAAYRDYLLASVGRVRADVAELRAEIAVDLRHAGGRAMGLEAIDGVLRAAINAAAPALYERLATAMAPSFANALAAEVEALAARKVPALGVVEGWFSDRGVLGAQLARIRDLTCGFLARDARMLETLLDAAFNEGAS